MHHEELGTQLRPEPLVICGHYRVGFKGEFLRPAILTEEEIESLLARVPRGRAYTQISDLLITNGNNPIHVYTIVRGNVNKIVMVQ